MAADVKITRFRTGDQGTLGVLETAGFACKTLELPWRDNRPNISCIPPGEYQCELHWSNRFQKHFYWIKDVPGRSWVLFHSGNVAGDESLGYKSHSEGCILLGDRHGQLDGQDAVLVSRPTVRRFVNHMEKKPFSLEIVWATELPEEE
ncbi:DUF5675 family protein [Desulfatibacillum aliphaticivorans]|uniref:DUF5675 family protein n=1 Tax=Desulfatibacillum aliphaticivorans TaxID=218208 RepID=UPI00042354C6|nr:DUF5675 family protein [Desulfatibacillum aliphaticivorans]